MAVSFSTNFSNLGLVTPQPKPLLAQPLRLFSAPLSFKSSNGGPCSRLRAQSNGSSNAASDKVLLEEQSGSPFESKSQSEEKEADGSTEGASEMQGEQQGYNLGKVMGTAGIVMAVIVGSTAALLSVNAILAELSDKVFDGRIRIQDFF